jgi:superfamily II DNA or RNA helicase
MAPSLVAESLARVRDPLPAWLDPGPPAPADRVASRLARALLPPVEPDPPPAWLRPDQGLSFGRTLAAARRYGGALLADRPGTGKSWIALAVAAALEPGRDIHVLAPASLRGQWSGVSRKTGIGIRFHSHELLSRGRPPDPEPGPIVLDESHRFRNPRTRRYQVLAPWCAGRRGILLSATPPVNRLADVVHQLLLLVRDDALGWAGIPSLRQAEAGAWPDELARLILTGEDRSGALPARSDRDLRIEDPADGSLAELQRGLRSLRLSRDPSIASLIRVSLLSALASSPEALLDALHRYRALLLHARDAGAAGRTLTRRTIRQFAGGELDQLVFWPLVAEARAETELALDDLAAVSALAATAREWCGTSEAKCRTLARIVADRVPTLVFTGARATVRYLRRRLGSGVAWCTGEQAGVDALLLPREDVLDLFRTGDSPAGGAPARPAVLVTTDVASEGLDLPRLARVVHYDLPWTAVRLEQRSGRAFRIGSRHADVEVIRFLPSRELEAALGRERILLRKAALPERLGLEEGEGARWRIRAGVARTWAGTPPASGVARVGGFGPAAVAGLRFDFSDGRSEEMVLARTPAGWTGEVLQVASLLDRARGADTGHGPNPHVPRLLLRQLAALARRRLRAARGLRLGLPSDPAVRHARRRLLALARQAGRTRHYAALGEFARGLRFLARGHTAGEALRIRTWAALSPDDLRAALARLPEEVAGPEVVAIRLTGLLLFELPEAPA